MATTLVPHGEELALPIDRALLEVLGLDAATLVVAEAGLDEAAVTRALLRVVRAR